MYTEQKVRYEYLVTLISNQSHDAS